MDYEKIVFDVFSYPENYNNADEYFLNEYRKVETIIPIKTFKERVNYYFVIMKKYIDDQFYKRKTELLMIKNDLIAQKESLPQEEFKEKWSIYESNLDFEKSNFYFHSHRFTNHKYFLNLDLNQIEHIEGKFKNLEPLFELDKLYDTSLNTLGDVKEFINNILQLISTNPSVPFDSKRYSKNLLKLSNIIDNLYLNGSMKFKEIGNFFKLIVVDINSFKIKQSNDSELSLEHERLNALCDFTLIHIDKASKELEKYSTLNELQGIKNEENNLDTSFDSQATYEQIKLIHDGLIKNKFIEYIDLDTFTNIFKNKKIPKHQKINWIKYQNQLTYFIKSLLLKKDIINEDNMWIKTSHCFLIKKKTLEPKKLSSSAEKNLSTKLPKDYKIINDILKSDIT